MRTRRFVVILLFVVVASAATPAGGVPWNKAPEQWTLADVLSHPAGFSLESLEIFPGSKLPAAS
jgi:hypothetical protein